MKQIKSEKTLDIITVTKLLKANKEKQRVIQIIKGSIQHIKFKDQTI